MMLSSYQYNIIREYTREWPIFEAITVRKESNVMIRDAVMHTVGPSNHHINRTIYHDPSSKCSSKSDAKSLGIPPSGSMASSSCI